MIFNEFGKPTKWRDDREKDVVKTYDILDSNLDIVSSADVEDGNVQE